MIIVAYAWFTNETDDDKLAQEYKRKVAFHMKDVMFITEGIDKSTCDVIMLNGESINIIYDFVRLYDQFTDYHSKPNFYHYPN